MTISRGRLELFERCLDDGWSFKEIADTHGTTHATLARHFPGRAWTKEQIRERLAALNSVRPRTPAKPKPQQEPKRVNRRGENNTRAKLTVEAVRAIRAAEGCHQDIADRFGISKPQVKAIRSRRAWKHVDDTDLRPAGQAG